MASKTCKAREICEPATPNPPPPLTVEDRIKGLQWAIDTAQEPWEVGQIKNIQAVIGMYQKGEIQLGDKVIVIDGKQVSAEERAPKIKTSFCFIELATVGNQFICKAAYGKNSNNMHEIYAQIRLPGSNGPVKRVTISNDTGSDYLTVFSNDLEVIENPTALVMVGIRLADGTVTFEQSTDVEVQLLTEDGDPGGVLVH